jgi:serine/threonine-protein kinase
MAPEQIAGQAVDCRADLFALGILLYCVTTGKHPFRGENPAETVKNICSESKPIAPSSIVAGYPSGLEAVVMKALEKSREARFESAHQMLEALEAAMPEPLEPSFDVKVGEYMHALVGKRAAERRAAIRVAQEHADRTRPDSTSISSGTLRAVAADRVENTPVSSPRNAALSALASMTPTATFRPRLPRWVLPVAGLLLAGSVLAVTLFVREAPVAPAASSPVPAALPPAARPAAASVESAEAASPAPSTASERDSDQPDASGETKKSRTRIGARAGAVKPRGAEPPAPIAAPAPSASAPQSASAPSVGAPPSANAWDRQQFGGRF